MATIWFWLKDDMNKKKVKKVKRKDRTKHLMYVRGSVEPTLHELCKCFDEVECEEKSIDGTQAHVRIDEDYNFHFFVKEHFDRLRSIPIELIDSNDIPTPLQGLVKEITIKFSVSFKDEYKEEAEGYIGNTYKKSKLFGDPAAKAKVVDGFYDRIDIEIKSKKMRSAGKLYKKIVEKIIGVEKVDSLYN